MYIHGRDPLFTKYAARRSLALKPIGLRSGAGEYKSTNGSRDARPPVERINILWRASVPRAVCLYETRTIRLRPLGFAGQANTLISTAWCAEPGGPHAPFFCAYSNEMLRRDPGCTTANARRRPGAILRLRSGQASKESRPPLKACHAYVAWSQVQVKAENTMTTPKRVVNLHFRPCLKPRQLPCGFSCFLWQAPWFKALMALM